VIKSWLPIFKSQSKRLIVETEEKISSLYRVIDKGSLTNSQLLELKDLEAIRHSLLTKEEQILSLINYG
jgi:hypothetical protein